jgi:hypothetical protein
MRPLTLRVSGLCLLLVTGCQARQLAHDSNSFRQAVISIYTEQALDNLVRARRGLPFVQMAYRDLYYQDDDTYTGSLSQDQTLTTRASLAVDTVFREFARLTHLGAELKRDKIMSLHADVITDQNDVYEKYLAFASDPNLLCDSDVLPKCGVHVWKKFNHSYYWVPESAGQEFLQLVLQTTFMRGPETTPPPVYWSAKVISVDKDWTAMDDGKAIYRVLNFDQPVPNGNALMLANLTDGRKIRLDLSAVLEGRDKSKPPLGKDITYLKASWNPKLRMFDADNLIGASAQIFSHDYPPPAVVAAPGLRRISDNLDAIRANTSTSRSRQ